MRAFFGLVNQVSYAFSMKDTMAPLRELLRPSATVYWDENLQKLFQEAKEEVVRKVEHGVKMFEMNRTMLLPIGHMRAWGSSYSKNIVSVGR